MIDFSEDTPLDESANLVESMLSTAIKEWGVPGDDEEEWTEEFVDLINKEKAELEQALHFFNEEDLESMLDSVANVVTMEMGNCSDWEYATTLYFVCSQFKRQYEFELERQACEHQEKVVLN